VLDHHHSVAQIDQPIEHVQQLGQIVEVQAGGRLVQEIQRASGVGPGKPAGELLRRYWQPIGFANELQGKPKKKRILGEDVVLFKDEFGKYGVLALRCIHRGTSLEFGHIESGGIRCCYHGWLFDVDGKVLETPGEGPTSTFKEQVHQPSYKVQELAAFVCLHGTRAGAVCCAL
jgi:nitrite reductase/ring-hydroxylating ferredoxin subunit